MKPTCGAKPPTDDPGPIRCELSQRHDSKHLAVGDGWTWSWARKSNANQAKADRKAARR